MSNKVKVAIIGSGNVATDLMEKIVKKSGNLEVAFMVGIDPTSDGLARAKKLGIATSHKGINNMIASEVFPDIKIVFEATTASAHLEHNAILQKHHPMHLIDLTPAAIGPYVIPVVNLESHINAQNINMVTCGGQATIPIVAAISKITEVLYAEIIASIASHAAGPGTRANIDEFTQTTAAAIEKVGGARRGKAIIILNPAEPPLLMRDTIFALTRKSDQHRIAASITDQVKTIQSYVPGYRLKQAIQFKKIPQREAHLYPDLNGEEGLQVSVFIEVEGAADHLPAYAGSLDIMTSAALTCGERIAENL